MEDGMKIVSDRWMLQSRQIVNWGSYGGYHVFRPSMDDAMPVTLLAGASESGNPRSSTRRSRCSTRPAPPTIRRRIRDVRNATTTRTCAA